MVRARPKVVKPGMERTGWTQTFKLENWQELGITIWRLKERKELERPPRDEACNVEWRLV